MYDVIIIGGGPAGLSAALYCGRYKLKTILMAKMMGGAITGAPLVENYPGIVAISGMQLTEDMRKQVERVQVTIEEKEVLQVKKTSEGFLVNGKYKGKNIILALGTERQKLNVPGERGYEGKGISYCATCDAPFFKDKVVGVVGGRDAALMSAELLTKYANKVYIIYRKDKLAAQPLTIEKITKIPKVEVLYNTVVTGVKGKGMMDTVVLNTGGEEKELPMDGLFIEIGSTPSVALAKQLGVRLDEQDYIIVDHRQATNVEGVYAAGDITNASRRWRQVLTACAEGALAAHAIYHGLAQTAHKPYEIK
jgi:thioredoxin reductase (NADPH)